MKATFQIPDELYREVKARSALEGRPVRDVVIGLFKQWVGQGSGAGEVASTDWENFTPPLANLVADPEIDHSMEAIRESIARRFDENV